MTKYQLADKSIAAKTLHELSEGCLFFSNDFGYSILLAQPQISHHENKALVLESGNFPRATVKVISGRTNVLEIAECTIQPDTQSMRPFSWGSLKAGELMLEKNELHIAYSEEFDDVVTYNLSTKSYAAPENPAAIFSKWSLLIKGAPIGHEKVFSFKTPIEISLGQHNAA